MDKDCKITLFDINVDDIAKPINDFLVKLTYGTMGIISTLAALVSVFYIIKLAFTIKKASGDLDDEKKRKAITNLIWVIVGFALCVLATTIFGLLLSIAGKK